MLSSLMRRLNERRAAEFELEGSADAGFTLIELMVVLLILAILLAIAIPTFLGVTGGANDRAAQSNLNTAVTTSKAAETQNNQSYNTTGGGNANITAATLKSNEPAINFLSTAPVAQGDVSVWVSSDGNGIVLSSYSKSGNCWYAVDNVNTVTATTNGLYSATGTPLLAGTQYGKKTSVTSAATCDATSTATTGIVWTSKFS